MNLAVSLTEHELAELRERTSQTDCADAVTLAAREYLRICRSRELATMAGQLDYDENAWRQMDQVEMNEAPLRIELDTSTDV